MSVPHHEQSKAAASPSEAHGGAHGHGHETIRQQEDRPDVRRLFIIGAVGVVITVVSVFISWGFQSQVENSMAIGATPAQVPEGRDGPGNFQAQGEHGIIERSLFVDVPGEPLEPIPGNAIELRRKKEAELGSYGWVDRPRGIIRIPIKDAMGKVVQAYGQQK